MGGHKMGSYHVRGVYKGDGIYLEDWEYVTAKHEKLENLFIEKKDLAILTDMKICKPPTKFDYCPYCGMKF